VVPRQTETGAPTGTPGTGSFHPFRSNAAQNTRYESKHSVEKLNVGYEKTRNLLKHHLHGLATGTGPVYHRIHEKAIL
jgi:hypothetical protein